MTAKSGMRIWSGWTIAVVFRLSALPSRCRRGGAGTKLAIDLVEAPAISTLTVECEDPVLAAKVSAASAGFLGSLSTPAVRECILEAAKRAGGKAAALKIDEESVEKRMIGGREVKCVYKVSLIVSIPSEGKK